MNLEQNLSLKFPFAPYQSQLALASEIYRSLADERKVSIFESPTGSGKSFSLIVGALGWLQDFQNGNVVKQKIVRQLDQQESLPNWFIEYEEVQTAPAQTKGILKTEKIDNFKFDNQNQQNKIKNQVDDQFLIDISSDDELVKDNKQKRNKINKSNQIIYCSRTHSQIKQWIQEIKKFKQLNKEIKLISQSSRQQLCINDKILSESKDNLSKLNYKCKQSQVKTQNKDSTCPCIYYKHFQNWKNEGANPQAFQKERIMDIEDLRQEGKIQKICPYYASKELIQEYDIVCMPYNLLFERLEQFQNPIALIDEAHNFGASVLQNNSIFLSNQLIENVHRGLNAYKQKYHLKIRARTFYFIGLLLIISELLIKLIKEEFSKLQKQDVRYKKLEIMQLLINLGMCNIDLIKVLSFLDNRDVKQRISGFIDQQNASIQQQNNNSFSNFQQFCSFIKLLLVANENESVVYIERSDNLQNTSIKISALQNERYACKQYKKETNINLISLYQDLINKVRNIILVGGTMYPLNDLEIFKQKCSNDQYIFKAYPHIIPEDNCKVFLVSGYKKKINFSYKQKSENLEDIYRETQIILKDIADNVPSGIVVFMQSYQILKQFKLYFQQNDQISLLGKQIFWDDHDKKQQQNIFNNYSQYLNEQSQQDNKKRGALLFSVVGGSLSEGINFYDDLCRAVILLGVPFANYQSMEISEMMKRCKDGRQMYENMAMKGVNQSVGRSIRHINDYSLIYLIDSAFYENSLKTKLSQWLQSKLHNIQDQQTLIQKTQQFFNKFN